MYVVGITESFTLAVPLRILPLIAGDFDGDVLNILYIINETFRVESEKIFNPRNAMQISRNDGEMNMDVNHTKDLIINGNALLELSREGYSKEEIEQINRLKEMAA